MTFRLVVDPASVAGAGAAVRAVGARLDAAPAGSALQLVAAAVPGGRLAAAAAQEAREWAGEMAEIGAVFERYARELAAAAAEQRRLDTAGARELRR